MAKQPGAIPTELRRRTPLKAGAAGAAAVTAQDAPRKKPFNPMQFFNEVRAEGRKITWTTWKETWITSVFVGVMVVLTAIFFAIVDSALSFSMSQILKINLGG